MTTDDQQGKGINTQLLGVSKDELPRVSISGSEVVRRQYLSHMKDIIVTIRPDGIQFNNSCIMKMEDTVYILILIDRSKHWLIVRACEENDKDGQRWCNVKDDVRKSRKITGRDFATRVYRMMGWNKGYYYRICGAPALRIDNEDELIMVFELDETEMYPMSAKARQSAGVEDEEIGETELKRLAEVEAMREAEKTERTAAAARGEKPKKVKKNSRFPETWTEDSFGTPIEDYSSRVVVPHLTKDDGSEQVMMFSPDDSETKSDH